MMCSITFMDRLRRQLYFRNLLSMRNFSDQMKKMCAVGRHDMDNRNTHLIIKKYSIIKFKNFHENCHEIKRQILLVTCE